MSRDGLSARRAADLLGVSRPHLDVLVDRERIPSTTTAGGHRRIRRSDIEAYRDRRARAEAQLRESMAVADEIASREG